MIANAAIWLFFVVAIVWVKSDLAAWAFTHLTLHPASADPFSVLRGEVWQLFTYMWLHDLRSPLHLGFNMLILYFFGVMFEQRWGRKGFLTFYVICGLGGAVVTVLASLLAPGLFGFPVIGASAAILGFLAAYATLFPENPIYLWMVLPIKGKILIPLTLGIDFLMFLTQSSDVAFAAHVGGILAGYLLVTGLWRPRLLLDIIPLKGTRRRGKGRRRMWVVRDDDDDKGPWLN